jgi:HSP20 family protein
MIPTQWRPFREFGLMPDRMSRLFDEFLSRMGQRFPDIDFLHSGWTPAVDIFETDKEIVVKVDLPGMTKEELALELKENSLAIRGERKLPEGTSRENYLQMERAYGKFERTLILGKDVDPEKANARLEHGILEITLPKTERAIRKHITIG